MKKIICLFCSLGLVFAMSCQRERDVIDAGIQPQDISTDVTTATTADHYGKITEKDFDVLHGRMTDFYLILKKMYADEKVVSEVNDFVGVGFYADESIVLKDLFSPETSPWLKNARLSGYGNFKEAFDKEFEKQANNSARLRTSSEGFTEYLVKNGVSIYFPYSENHLGKKYDEITIVMPPKEDVNSAMGIRLEKCGNEICEEKVLVDDN